MHQRIVCNDNIFFSNTSMHFDGLFDCSKGHFNTVTEGSCLFTRIEIRIDVKGGGERVSSERQFDVKH